MSGLSATMASTAGTTAAAREEQFTAPAAQFESEVRLQIIESDLSSRMRMSACAGEVSMLSVLPQAATVELAPSRIGLAASSSGVRMPMHPESKAKVPRRLHRK